MDLREQINDIKIIDDHMHALDDVQWIRGTGSFPWPDHIAHLPLPDSLTTLPQKKALFAVYRELYGFRYSALNSDNVIELDDLYQKSRENEAIVYEKAFKTANIESAVGINQDSLDLAPQLDPRLYKLAPVVDGLLVPLDNTVIKESLNNETAVIFMKMYESFLKNMMGPQNITSFDDYLKFISSLLVKIHKRGCACLKMNYAYWRDIAVEVVSEEEARNIFESGNISLSQYKRLQDFLLRDIISKAADFDLPVQIHTGAINVPHSMLETGPARLDSFLMLPDIRKAKVVLLHGGYPFCREAGFMVGRSFLPNLYLDISQIWWQHYGSPVSLVKILREWLEMGIAEKMLYGSDANTPLRFMTGAIQIREGLYLALKGTISDGLIDENQALKMARMVLRENAVKLYKM